MKTLIDWVNIPEEDKYGCFVLMGYMSEEDFEELCSRLPICGTNHMSMIPLECMETAEALVFAEEFLAVVDGEWIRLRRGIAMVNREDCVRLGPRAK